MYYRNDTKDCENIIFQIKKAIDDNDRNKGLECMINYYALDFTTIDKLLIDQLEFEMDNVRAFVKRPTVKKRKRKK